MDIKKHRDKVAALKKYLVQMNIPVNDFSYYQQALTHRSYSNELRERTSYQRLEYLGDSVLDKIVCEILYHLPQHLDEGQMSTVQRMLVQQNTIVRAAREIGLVPHIFLGKGVGQQVSEKIIGDCFEAFIAAVYLDQNNDETIPRRIISQTLIAYYLDDDLAASTDYKSILQEKLQINGKQKIEYRLINPRAKNCFNRIYEVEVVVSGVVYGRGRGHSIRTAERVAAQDALNRWSAAKGDALI